MTSNCRTIAVERASGLFAALSAAKNPKRKEMLHANPEKGGGDH